MPEIEAVKLARLVFNALFEMCCLWMKELPFRRRPQPYYETSIHAIKNMRRKMEDKHVIIPDFNTLFNVQVCCPTKSCIKSVGLTTSFFFANNSILLKYFFFSISLRALNGQSICIVSMSFDLFSILLTAALES